MACRNSKKLLLTRRSPELANGSYGDRFCSIACHSSNDSRPKPTPCNDIGPLRLCPDGIHSRRFHFHSTQTTINWFGPKLEATGFVAQLVIAKRTGNGEQNIMHVLAIVGYALAGTVQLEDGASGRGMPAKATAFANAFDQNRDIRQRSRKLAAGFAKHRTAAVQPHR